jgi:transketolase
MAASQYMLGNIIVVVDNNQFQSDGSTHEIISSSRLAEKWRSFGWNVHEVDGHDVDALSTVLTSGVASHQPTCVVAHTVKGKGIDFMENNNEWHHNRLTQSAYEKAAASLEANS